MRALKKTILYFTFIISILFVVSCRSNKLLKYSVFHYIESGSEYVLREVEELKGRRGEYTNASYKDYEGFSPSGEIKQKKIPSSDNTIKLYYSRNTYHFSVTYDDTLGSVSDVAGDYKYDYDVDLCATPKDGYKFDGWYNGETLISNKSDYSFGMPASDITYEAKFSLDDRLLNFIYEIDNDGIIIKGIKDKNAINIVVPSYVSKIEEGAFNGCSRVESITLPFIGESNVEYGNGIIYPLGYIFGKSAFDGASQIHQNYRETYIGEDSYSSTLKIASYYIPNSLREVELNGASVLPSYGLSKTGVNRLTINPGIKIVAQDAFRDVNLSDVYFNGEFNELCKIDCSKCSLINGQYHLLYKSRAGDYKEYGGDTLYLDSSVEEVGAGFFNGDLDLKTVEISSNVRKINEDAFYRCDNIESVYFDGDVKLWASIEMGDYANPCGYSGKLYLLDENGDVKYNDNTYSLIGSEIDLRGVNRIESNVFNSFESITSIIFYDHLLSIGAGAFEGTSITSLTLPSTIENIDDSAFRSCDYLTKIYYDGTIDQYVEISLESSLLSDSISLYVLDENGDEENNGKKYRLVEGDVVLNCADKISSYAFAEYDKITSLTLNKGIKSIGDSFIAETSIEEITIPTSVEFIDECAFYDANHLTVIHNLSNIYINEDDFEIPQGCTVLN